MLKKCIVLVSLFFVLIALSDTVNAQCAMCKRVAETSMEGKHKEKSARGLNSGILYLLSVPYLIGAVGVFAWYRNRKKGE